MVNTTNVTNQLNTLIRQYTNMACVCVVLSFLAVSLLLSVYYVFRETVVVSHSIFFHSCFAACTMTGIVIVLLM